MPFPSSVLCRLGAADVVSGVKNARVAFIFGWQDVAQRYRRSRVGAFWLTINMSVLIIALGVVFGTLFRIPVAEFLPFIGTGLIIWNFISQTISDGCVGFISSAGTILQVPLPHSTHLLRVVWRNVIIFLHNIVIIPVLFIVFGTMPNWWILLAPVGLLVLTVNVAWMALIAAIICTRYRDMVQVIQNIMQVLFYASPIMWVGSRLPEGAVRSILNFNPFLHLVEISRDPILGTPPSLTNWIVSIGLALVGWALALILLGVARRRIAYWL